MKRLSIILSILLAFTILTIQAGILPTSLKVTVVDRLGNRVEGAQVVIYGSQDDYVNQTNPIAEGQTDEKGKISFKKLKPVIYFIDARNDDMHNDGMGAKTEPLNEGKINSVHAVIH